MLPRTPPPATGSPQSAIPIPAYLCRSCRNESGRSPEQDFAKPESAQDRGRRSGRLTRHRLLRLWFEETCVGKIAFFSSGPHEFAKEIAPCHPPTSAFP